jgi:hypothetical protein
VEFESTLAFHANSKRFSQMPVRGVGDLPDLPEGALFFPDLPESGSDALLGTVVAVSVCDLPDLPESETAVSVCDLSDLPKDRSTTLFETKGAATTFELGDANASPVTTLDVSSCT